RMKRGVARLSKLECLSARITRDTAGPRVYAPTTLDLLSLGALTERPSATEEGEEIGGPGRGLRVSLTVALSVRGDRFAGRPSREEKDDGRRASARRNDDRGQVPGEATGRRGRHGGRLRGPARRPREARRDQDHRLR